MTTLEELTAAYAAARHTWIQTTLSDTDIWHRAIAHQKAVDALINAQQARIAELERERDTAMRRTGHVLNAARIVLEDIFEFPVNMQEVVYVQGYDGGLSRRRLALHGDTAGDVLRLKALIDELIAASPPADAPKEE